MISSVLSNTNLTVSSAFTQLANAQSAIISVINKELCATKISTRLLSLKNARDYKQSISDGDIQYVYIARAAL